jgi:YVTN family beta-propeller protein
MIYVANTHSNNVTIIDGKTNFVVAVVDSGEGPYSIAVNTVTNKIYVANRLSSKVTVIDGRTNRAVQV